MFDDVYFNPVSTAMLIDYVHALLDINRAGVINISCDEKITKYDFSVKLAKNFGMDPSNIQPTQSWRVQNNLVRPKDLSLNNGLLKKKLGLNAISIDDVLKSLSDAQENCDELLRTSKN